MAIGWLGALVKNANIVRTAEALGLVVHPRGDWGKGIRTVCPFHKDTNPSLQLYPDGPDRKGKFNRYHCKTEGCNASGDSVDLVLRIRIGAAPRAATNEERQAAWEFLSQLFQAELARDPDFKGWKDMAVAQSSIIIFREQSPSTFVEVEGRREYQIPNRLKFPGNRLDFHPVVPLEQTEGPGVAIEFLEQDVVGWYRSDGIHLGTWARPRVLTRWGRRAWFQMPAFTGPNLSGQPALPQALAMFQPWLAVEDPFGFLALVKESLPVALGYWQAPELVPGSSGLPALVWVGVHVGREGTGPLRFGRCVRANQAWVPRQLDLREEVGQWRGLSSEQVRELGRRGLGGTRPEPRTPR